MNFINHAGEHWLQTRMSLALANRIKIKDENGNEINLYEAYEIKKIEESAAQNIIIVMGESIRSQSMGLYQYHRPTSPLLTSLSKKETFVYKNCFSLSNRYLICSK